MARSPFTGGSAMGLSATDACRTEPRSVMINAVPECGICPTKSSPTPSNPRVPQATIQTGPLRNGFDPKGATLNLERGHGGWKGASNEKYEGILEMTEQLGKKEAAN